MKEKSRKSRSIIGSPPNEALTPAERAQLDIIRSRFGYCRASNCNGIVQKEQKPIKWTDLTWKDIVELEGIINNVHYEFRNGIGQESFGKEVLEKFREYKGDEYLDEKEQKPETLTDGTKEYTIREDYTSAYYEERGYARGYNDGIRDSKLVSSKPPQKAAEKQDYSGLNDLERAIHRGFLCAGVENVPVGIIKETAQDCLAHLPVEWSEEDNIGWDEAFACVTRAEKDAKNEEELQNAVTAEKWFKEIKFKYCVHPVKPEWSEEDEKIRNLAIEWAETMSGQFNFVDMDSTDFRKITNWLKSLRPPFKPSEEQMNCLCAAVDAAIRKHNESVSGYEPARVLKSLYEHLQKL